MTEPTSEDRAQFRKYDYAGAYHHELMDSDAYYIAKVQRALSIVRPACVVLDVGCGDGVFVKYAAGNGASVIGIDPSEQGVRLARKMSGSSGLCVASAHMLPLRASSVDVVVMIDVINYLSHCEEAILEAARVLRLGGVLMIMSPCDVSLEVERATTQDSWQTHAWDSEAVRALVEKYFTVDDLSFIEKAMPIAGLGLLAGWLKAAGVLGVVRRVARAFTRGSSQPETAGSARAVMPTGDIVLNTSALPDVLLGRREKLEFIVLAKKNRATPVCRPR